LRCYSSTGLACEGLLEELLQLLALWRKTLILEM